MATYDYPITLEYDGVGSLDYSYVAPSTTYTGSTLGMYFKAGDTIGNTITNPSGGNIGDVAANAAANPDPTNSGAQPSGTKYYATTTSSAAWATTTWLIFGRNTSSGNPADRSNRFVWKRVSGSISLNSTTVTQGGTLSGTVSQTGLEPPGTNSHRLYLRVWNSATSADFTYFNGGSLGSVTSSGLSFSLSVAANTPVGTYELVLTHYAPTGSGSGAAYQTQNYYGRNQQLHSVTFTVQGPRTYPDQFELGGPTTNAALETKYYSNTVTMAGIASGQTATVSISGTDSKYKIGSGSYTTNNSQISNGQTITVENESSSSLNSTNVSTLTVTGVNPSGSSVAVSDTFSTTTTSSQDTTPNAFELGSTLTNVVASTIQYSDTITIAGLGSGVTTPVSIQGTGTSVSPQFSINSGTYGTSGSVDNGDTVRTRLTSSNTAGGTNYLTLSIGGVSDTFTAVTAGSGSGSGTGGGSGTAGYGLEIFNWRDTTGNGVADSLVNIFGPNFRSCSLVATGTAHLASTGSPGSMNVTYNTPTIAGMTSTNKSTFGIVMGPIILATLMNISVLATRNNTNFTVTAGYLPQGNYYATWWVFRY